MSWDRFYINSKEAMKKRLNREIITLPIISRKQQSLKCRCLSKQNCRKKSLGRNHKPSAISIGLFATVFSVVPIWAEEPVGDTLIELSPYEIENRTDTEIQEEFPSASIFDPIAIEQAGIINLKDITRYVPDMTYVAGSSSPRFFLMRGIGELDQYEDHVAPSVSFYVDEIDLTGLAGGLLLYDLSEIVVTHGPSGSMGGGGGFAGSIQVYGMPAEAQRSGNAQVTVGDYNTLGADLAVGGRMTEKNNLRYRFSLSRYISDGFIENKTLDRKDVQNYDEWAGRLRLEWDVTETLETAITLLYIDQDNGYDAFNYDYSTWKKTTDGLTTLSDQPGKDRQIIKAASWRADWQGNAPFRVTNIVTGALIDTHYYFDGDWLPGGEINGYKHDRYYVTEEIRLSSLDSADKIKHPWDWSAGLFYKHDDDDSKKTHVYYNSSQNIDRIALYANMRYRLNSSVSLTWGGRTELYYVDFDDSEHSHENPSDTLLSGFVGVEYEPAALQDWLLFSRIRFGEHASGVNTDDVPPGVGKDYDKESLTVFELGFEQSCFDGRWQNSVTAFYQYRENPQIKRWEYNSTLGWIGYTVNGDHGEAYGVELQSRLEALPDMISLFANMSLIKTEVWSDLVPTMHNGREQSHTPTCQYSFGTDIGASQGFFGRAEVVGMTSFYFDNFDYAKSHPYALLNLRVGYRMDNWAITFWINNVFDRSYDTRGMDFDTDDPHSEVYLQRGEPRFFGVTASYSF